jgi:uncharacterized membrane protein YozB (DUF420 family)
MSPGAKSDGLAVAALLALGLVPVLAGTLRLVQLGAGAAITPANARFFAAPWPVVLHIVCATLFSILGALMFAPGWRRRHLGWHRRAGRWLVPCGLVTALSGLWMTQFYPPGLESPASFDGTALYAIRLLAGSAMALCLCLGLAAVLRRDIPRHQAWMVRAYALGLGAGTQVFTHIPWFVFPSIQGEMARTLCMAAGWLINVAVAEWLTRSRQALDGVRRLA